MKQLTPKNILIALLILAIIYLVTCHKKTVVTPVIKPSSEIVKAIVNIDSIKNAVSDSFTSVIKEKDREIIVKNNQYENLLIDYLNQANDFEDSLRNKNIPDTCKPYQLHLINQYNTLANTSAKKDSACKALVQSLNTQNKTKDNFLVAKDKQYKDLHNILDTCVKGYKQLESALKKAQPKREVNIGVNMLSGYSLPLNTIFGLNVGYRNRKGFEVSVGYYTNNQISIGLKKTLFKF